MQNDYRIFEKYQGVFNPEYAGCDFKLEDEVFVAYKTIYRGNQIRMSYSIPWEFRFIFYQINNERDFR